MKTIFTSLVLICSLSMFAQTEPHEFTTKDPFRLFFSTGASLSHGEIWEGLGVGAGTSKVWYEGGIITSKFNHDISAYLLGHHIITHVGKSEAYVGLNASVKCDRSATVGLQPLLKAIYNCDKNVALYAQIGLPLSEYDNYKVHNPGFGVGLNVWLKRYGK